MIEVYKIMTGKDKIYKDEQLFPLADRWTTRPQLKDPKRSIKLRYQKTLLQPTSGQRME